jgi:uncharacterized membrane protein YsdA (DUF1294 family)
MYIYIFAYLMAINLVSYLLMYVDKQRAKKNEYRIREATLWQVAIFGGALGAFIGMRSFRHKTKHQSFKWGLPILTVLEIGLLLFFVTN